jgi:hypothetical protein
VLTGSHQAFMNGVHTATLLTGVLCVVAAVVAATMIRHR